MPRLITCFHSGRTGRLVANLDNKRQGTNLLCEDEAGRFVVLKRKPIQRPVGRTRKQRKALRKGQRVTLEVRDLENTYRVPAVYQGVRGRQSLFRCVDDPVWDRCLIEGRECRVVEVQVRQSNSSHQ